MKIEIHWDLDSIWDNLKHYPDQELVSMLLQGVQYKADLDLQIVLLPHLISFGAGCPEGVQQFDIEIEIESFRVLIKRSGNGTLFWILRATLPNWGPLSLVHLTV